MTPDQLGAGRVNVARAVVEAQQLASAVPAASVSRVAVGAPLASVGETVAVRVEVRSAGAFPVIGREVSLRSNRASDAVTSERASTDSQGVATFQLRAAEEGIAELRAEVGGTLIGTARAVFARALTAPIGIGSLLRGSAATVYLIASDGKRYVFPDSQTFRSWVPDANGVQLVGDAILAAFPLGGLVTIRPGTFLVKVQTDPKTYAVESGSVLRWVPDEATAIALYGAAWAARVVDVPDAFFTNYRTGAPVSALAHPNGAILEDARDGERYLIVAGQRRRFASTLAFLKNGFQWRDVIRVPAVAYPDGAPIAEREVGLAQSVL